MLERILGIDSIANRREMTGGEKEEDRSFEAGALDPIFNAGDGGSAPFSFVFVVVYQRHVWERRKMTPDPSRLPPCEIAEARGPFLIERPLVPFPLLPWASLPPNRSSCH